MESTTTASGTGRPGQQAVSHHQQHERGRGDGEDGRARGSELVREAREPPEEMVASAGDTERARELRHRDADTRTGLEAEQDRVADEARELAQPKRPGRDGEPGDEQRDERRYRRETLRVAGSHRRDARAH
jgi:hypothetical protein